MASEPLDLFGEPFTVATKGKDIYTKVHVPRAEVKLPSTHLDLPVIRAARQLLFYWQSIQGTLKPPITTVYGPMITQAVFSITTLSISLHEGRTFYTPEERHSIFCRLQEDINMLYTILDVFEHQHVVGARRLNTLIRHFLEIKKNIFTWRNHSFS